VLVVESDTKSGLQLLVAYPQKPFDLVINTEIGAIINSIRSGLDLLAAALATRNGVKSSEATHFPIFGSLHDFIDPKIGIESKKWLSQREKATIKSFKPYKGGDFLLYPLHQLDIRRKHERLITIKPRIMAFSIQAEGPGLALHYQVLEDKTVLYRLPATSRFSSTQRNSHITAEIAFNEPSLGLIDEPAFPLLPRFAHRIAEIIRLFDCQ
jgi:hypothetical protein